MFLLSFDFDKMTNRFDTNSYKWDVGLEELPLWVADMDFETAPPIAEAIRKRAEHRIYGYNRIPDTYYQAVAEWWRQRHHFNVDPKWVLFCTGVVPAISSIVRKITEPGDQVLVLTPVYNIFFNSIVNNGRTPLVSELIYQNHQYEIDYEDLEQKLADPSTTLMIFCNPHNPIGMVWDRYTLERVGNLCLKHGVVILSDEIHCDLTHPDKTYTPFASISKEIAQHSITCVAPTKTFNLAGLQTSSIIVPNAELRSRVNRGINTDEVAEPNAFAIDAAIAAFTEGGPWLNALLAYLMENKRLIESFVAGSLPEVQVIASDATYLAWLDCGAVTKDAKLLAAFIRKETGLFVSEGSVYRGNGGHFLRLNYACPRERLEDGLQRLKKGIDAFPRS
ncbi:MalY/PatB family protein [Gorillibacterium sp. CAU 1737]|uniref:MalY/PatB family protein n=1 Tax=Gorillibacterium sp. CAU 1737 TaxID=3140362 RepID=UPI00325FDFB8